MTTAPLYKGKIIVCSINWIYHPAETLLFIKKTEEGLKISKNEMDNASFFKVTRHSAQSVLNLMPFRNYLETISRLSIKRIGEDYFLSPASEEEIDEFAIYRHEVGYVGRDFDVNIPNNFVERAKENLLNPVILMEIVKSKKQECIKVFVVENSCKKLYPNCREISTMPINLSLDFIKNNNIYPKDVLRVEFSNNCMTIKPKKQKCAICEEIIDPFIKPPKKIKISTSVEDTINKEIKEIFVNDKNLKEHKEEFDKRLEEQINFDIIKAKMAEIKGEF